MDYFNLSSAISRTPKLSGIQGIDHGSSPPSHHHSSHTLLDREGQELAGCLALLMLCNLQNFDARGLANRWDHTEYAPTA